MTAVVIALGSNLGDRAGNLSAAVDALSAYVDDIRTSRVYETAPKYVTDQPQFLNMALCGHVQLAPAELLSATQAVERDLGRTPGIRFGPRIIDVDLIFHGDTVLETLALTLPHPRLRERAFVLRPVADICADWIDPVTGRSVRQLLERLPVSDDIVPIGTVD